jgi:hypothetical protein
LQGIHQAAQEECAVCRVAERNKRAHAVVLETAFNRHRSKRAHLLVDGGRVWCLLAQYFLDVLDWMLHSVTNKSATAELLILFQENRFFNSASEKMPHSHNVLMSWMWRTSMLGLDNVTRTWSASIRKQHAYASCSNSCTICDTNVTLMVSFDASDSEFLLFEFLVDVGIPKYA